MIEVPEDNEHIPFRDSKCCPRFGQVWEAQPKSTPTTKLTRLLSVHLNGNSQTGLLVGSQGKVIGWYLLHRCMLVFGCHTWFQVQVTLTPSEDAIEQSLTTLRFAQKADLNPVLGYVRYVLPRINRNHLREQLHYIPLHFQVFPEILWVDIARHVRSRRLRKFDVLQSPS